MNKSEIIEILNEESLDTISDKGKEAIEAIGNLVNHRDLIEVLLFIIDSASNGIKYIHRKICLIYSSDLENIKSANKKIDFSRGISVDEQVIQESLNLGFQNNN